MIFRQASFARKPDQSMDWFAILLPVFTETLFATAQCLFAFYVCPILVRPLIISSGQLITAIPILMKFIYDIQRARERDFNIFQFSEVKVSMSNFVKVYILTIMVQFALHFEHFFCIIKFQSRKFKANFYN